MQSFIMNSHEVFIHIHQGCFAGTGAIVRLPQCQWSKPGGYGKISQCITTTKHSKAKTVCIFFGIYCICIVLMLYGTTLSLSNVEYAYDLTFNVFVDVWCIRCVRIRPSFWFIFFSCCVTSLSLIPKRWRCGNWPFPLPRVLGWIRQIFNLSI